METPFDLLPYLFLFSAFFVAMKCYMNQYRKNKAFLGHVTFYDVKRFDHHQYDCVVLFPIYRLFTSQQRKIPVRERSNVSDEEGRPLLVRFISH
ncbi:hypothetical protein [Anoxybacillus sp. J5B_2022]|uniref:hypothetical protein n=1 Tax=Anoxybacillus sp. J5B_2022 TaxID=3003246 RepID=UPI0022869E32|nr:hypothetical protein [Anoxybacillus sp. J5B_2022]MCZ0755093.1 hypothetical protein [Anoxybacillus sp. J5B_2022]